VYVVSDSETNNSFDIDDKPLSNEQLGSECPSLTTEERRGQDSNSPYQHSPVRRFSKPLPKNCSGGQGKDLEQSQTGAYKPPYKENPELKEVVVAWPELPAYIKATITTLVQTKRYGTLSSDKHENDT
jgi:hypothetical protein